MVPDILSGYMRFTGVMGDVFSSVPLLDWQLGITSVTPLYRVLFC